MRITAGVDVGNATTEVAVLAGDRLLAVASSPTRGPKGSAESLRGAASLVRRLERRHDWRVDEARIAPLRPVQTTTVAAAPAVRPAGRLRLAAAGAATPGRSGQCVGPLLWLDRPVPARPADGQLVVVIPAGLGYDRAAARLRGLLAVGVPVGAVLIPGDEGVLVANRIDAAIPVVDQVDVAVLESCSLAAVEVRGPGQPLRLLTDPVALGAAFRLGAAEEGDAVALCRSLVDYSNAVIGCAGPAADFVPPPVPGAVPELWVRTDRQRFTLREACALLPDWPAGTVRAVSAGSGPAEVDDLFAIDLGAVADTAAARRGSLGRAVVAASLHRLPLATDLTGQLSDLIGCPVRSAATEPAAARLGALTTPGARPDAVVVDVGAITSMLPAPTSR